MVLKQDGSDMPFEPTDFRVGLDIGLCGRSIRVYDADAYTREFFTVSEINHFALKLRNVFSKIFIRRLINIYSNRILDNPKPTHSHAQRTTLASHRSQFLQRRIQSSSNSWRRNWAVAELHLRNNSWTMIGKCLDSTLSLPIFSLSGITSWQMTLLRSEKSTSPTMVVIVSQYT